MAERRMFAKTIIDSDAFLDMPVSARLLYYDLAMRADDDGFVNSPKKIQRMVGASDDDLKILAAKKFIIPFESGVVVIKHWKIHNYIRKDTYNETTYKDEKSMLIFDNNNAYKVVSSTERQRNVNEQSTQVRLGKDSIGKDSIGKDSIGKDSIGKDKEEDETVPIETSQEIVNLWNSVCTSYQPVVIVSLTRKERIDKLYRQVNNIELFRQAFQKIENSNFCKGDNDKKWKADFEWILKDSNNIIKVLEGKYDNPKTYFDKLREEGDPYEKT